MADALRMLGWVIIHAVWQAAVVAGGLALVLRFGRAPAALRYATAYGALLLVAALSAVTGAMLTTLDAAALGGDVGSALTAVKSPSTGGVPSASGVLFAVHAALAPAVTWLSLAWLAGVAVLLVRWCGAWWILARLATCGARPARAAWNAALMSAAERTGVTTPVTLLESTKVDTPTVVGHRRPVVLLPVPAFEALASAEAESVLAHELAHVRRADFAANGAQALIELLFFFHPAVRWVSRMVREERELCCDDVAVRVAGSRVVYARALARLEAVRSSVGGGRLALAANGGTLLRRIQRLANGVDGSERPGVRPRLVTTLAVITTFASLAAFGRLVFPATVHALAADMRNIRAADRYTVHAHDPAGEFSITFERGRPTHATVGGVAVGARRLVTRGDSLYLPWQAGYFAVRLKPGGFTWAPRRGP
jgi:beta-lactamase regulating signal transducer with metallopeptidase domain